MKFWMIWKRHIRTWEYYWGEWWWDCISGYARLCETNWCGCMRYSLFCARYSQKCLRAWYLAASTVKTARILFEDNKMVGFLLRALRQIVWNLGYEVPYGFTGALLSQELTRGSNTGINVLYSGTVAGKPGIRNSRVSFNCSIPKIWYPRTWLFICRKIYCKAYSITLKNLIFLLGQSLMLIFRGWSCVH